MMYTVHISAVGGGALVTMEPARRQKSSSKLRAPRAPCFQPGALLHGRQGTSALPSGRGGHQFAGPQPSRTPPLPISPQICMVIIEVSATAKREHRGRHCFPLGGHRSTASHTKPPAAE
jgi:hypothetical protein